MANKLSSENAAQLQDTTAMPRDHNNPPALVEMFVDDIKTRYATEFAKVDPIRAKANARPQSIDSDVDLAAWTEIFTEARALWKALDENRLAEARPFAAAVKETFEPNLLPLERVMQWIKTKADAYNRDKLQRQRKQEAEEREKVVAAERKAREDAAIAAEFGDTDKAVEHIVEAATAQAQAAQAAPAKVADLARVADDTGKAKSTAGAVWKFTIADYTAVDLNAIRMFFPPGDIDKAVAKLVKQQKGATKVAGVVVYEDVATSFRQ